MVNDTGIGVTKAVLRHKEETPKLHRATTQKTISDFKLLGLIVLCC